MTDGTLTTGDGTSAAGAAGSDGAAPRVAVLLCGYGEVEHNEELTEYNAAGLRLLVSKSIRIPEAVVPFLSRRLARKAQREYEVADDYHSPHNAIFERQRAGIETALRARYGDRVGVFKAFNFIAAETPAEVLAKIRAEGYDRLLVYPLLVVDSVYTGGLALEQVNDALGDDARWVKSLRYLPSFFERPDYHARMAQHIRDLTGPLQERMPTSQIGIVLLNHGCPYKAKGFETGIRESRLLFQAVRERLITEFPTLTLGWMNHPTPGRWTQPTMLQAAKNLVTLGARVIVFAPIGFVTDNHETMLDVGYVAKKLGSTETMILPSLNDDAAFLEMAAQWVTPLIDELRGERSTRAVAPGADPGAAGVAAAT